MNSTKDTGPSTSWRLHPRCLLRELRSCRSGLSRPVRGLGLSCPVIGHLESSSGSWSCDGGSSWGLHGAGSSGRSSISGPVSHGLIASPVLLLGGEFRRLGQGHGLLLCLLLLFFLGLFG